MKHEDKINWMIHWCHENRVRLELDGSCGIGRECVGITTKGNYPEYYTTDDDFNRMDNNGDVWKPKNAYHKHPCVAVLGRGEDSESQLYDWLKWFDDNNFTVEVSIDNGALLNMDPVLRMFDNGYRVRMVKKKSEVNKETNDR